MVADTGNLMIDLNKGKKTSPFQYLKLESLSEQNSDPALWQIADPYIGLTQFSPIGRMKIFSLLSLYRLSI